MFLGGGSVKLAESWQKIMRQNYFSIKIVADWSLIINQFPPFLLSNTLVVYQYWLWWQHVSSLYSPAFNYLSYLVLLRFSLVRTRIFPNKKDQRVQKLKISDGQMGTFTLLFCSLKNIKYGAEKFLTQLRSLSKQNVKILASTLHIFKWLHFYFVQICIYYTFVCVYEIDWLSQPNKYIHTSGKGKTYGYCNTKFIQTWN